MNSPSTDRESRPEDKPEPPAEVLVGRKLRERRLRHGLTLRELADRSGLNINTLSLVENGKSSPSVGTLQQLARVLGMPMAAFFEGEPVSRQVVFTPLDQRPQAAIGRTRMQNLGKDLAGSAVQPFVIDLPPGGGSGDSLIVHTGHEFVYCLSGLVHYRVDGDDFLLHPGDSLVFQAHLPHCWHNPGEEAAQIILVLFPSDEREVLGGRHFSLDVMKKELTLKIAVITDDGTSVSQHFGRAAYYQVLTIEAGKVVNRELRSKLGHHQFSAQHGAEHHDPDHGLDPASHQRHVGMAEAIADCQFVLCGGMGRGAYESMQRLNIQPVVTNHRDIDEAAQAFIEGKLVDHIERLH